MPPYSGGATLTVDVLLRQPAVVSRSLTSLAAKRFIADRIFGPGSPEQVAGGAARYQKSESIYMDRDADKLAERGGFLRAGWTEEIFTAPVEGYGLEAPVTGLAKRRNATDVVARAQRKIANSIVKQVDSVAMTLLHADADVQTFAAGTAWSGAGDPVADLATAIGMLAAQDEGYEDEPLVGIFHWDEWESMVNNAALRAALPREARNNITTQQVMPILGISELIITNRATSATGFVLVPGLVGTIADELPDPREGYGTYNPDESQRVIHAKTYPDPMQVDDTIVRGARWPAMWLAEPKAAVKITAL